MFNAIKVSVVIETDSIHSYDDIRIEDCLRALAVQTYPRELLEFILIDGGKSSNLEVLVQTFIPGVLLLKLPGATKFEQKNLGLQHATGEIVAFVDGDCAPPPEWIEKIVQELSAAPSEVAGVQGITRLTRKALSRELSALFYGPRSEDHTRNSSRLVTDNCAFRREILLKFPFEHPEFSTVSDTLLLLKLRKSGYRLQICESLVMHHSFPGLNRIGFGWFFGRAFGVGYYMVKARQIEPELRGSGLVRYGGLGWPLLAAAKWLLDLKQIHQNRRRLQASFLAAFPLTLLYHPTLFAGGVSALLGRPPKQWS